MLLRCVPSFKIDIAEPKVNTRQALLHISRSDCSSIRFPPLHLSTSLNKMLVFLRLDYSKLFIISTLVLGQHIEKG